MSLPELIISSILHYAEIEHRLDKKIGVHLRCQFYSEVLIEHPDTVKLIIFQGFSWFNKTVFQCYGR